MGSVERLVGALGPDGIAADSDSDSDADAADSDVPVPVPAFASASTEPEVPGTPVSPGSLDVLLRAGRIRMSTMHHHTPLASLATLNPILSLGSRYTTTFCLLQHENK
jgi:hypothetical protein